MIGTFTFREMFLLDWPVISILLACSILSLAVILERWVYFRKRRVDVKDYTSRIEKVLVGGKDAANQISSFGEPLSLITRQAITHPQPSREALELAVDRIVRMQVAEMERFVPMLGTIAGAAPFIGLLGTVIGIIRAFQSIATSNTGGPQVVAGGISEALIATALGLSVAIPALVSYNYFSTKIRRLTEGMEICSDQLVEILSQK